MECLKSFCHIYEIKLWLLLLQCIFILLSLDSVRSQLLDDQRTFHCNDYFVVGEIRTCLGVSRDPIFQWTFLNFCPLNLLLDRSHQAEIIIVKSLIQGRPRWGLNPDNAIRVVVKTTPLPIQPRCLHCADKTYANKNSLHSIRVSFFFNKETTLRSCRSKKGRDGKKCWNVT